MPNTDLAVEITGKYVENKPIHGTQKSKWLDDDTLEVKIDVIINYEVERLILSYGPSTKVVSPLKLQQSVCEKLNKNLNQYI